MKCELCHKADAQQAIRKSVNNETQELYVCKACAEAQLPKKEKPAVPQEPPPEIIEAIKETLPELMGMILGATVEFTGRIPSFKEPVCPLCGLTRAEYKKAARLGCAQCYETFIKDLDSVVGEMHRFPHHTGKKPKHPRPSKHAALLMERLRAAETENRAADAEELKARIRQLGWDPGTLEGPSKP
jgi:protein arginine kinase activator